MRSQERLHRNCVYNKEHLPRKLPYSLSDPTTELEIAPRKVTTLVVIQEEKSVRLCTYGSESPADWSGDICDSDDVSAGCRLFEPLIGPDEAADDFMSLLKDDKYVYENLRDLAALQWALEDRRPRLPWYVRLKAFLFGKPSQPVGLLPPGASEEVDRELENLWR